MKYVAGLNLNNNLDNKINEIIKSPYVCLGGKFNNYSSHLKVSIAFIIVHCTINYTIPLKTNSKHPPPPSQRKIILNIQSPLIHQQDVCSTISTININQQEYYSINSHLHQ